MTLRHPSVSSPVPAARWTGEKETTGTVAVVGLGKIGLPLAAQYLAAGWRVIGVDVIPSVVETLNQGLPHFDDEPGVGELLARGHAEGRFEATLSHVAAAADADVIVLIVPLMLGKDSQPDYTAIDAATRAVAEGLRRSTLVIYETTVPVGDTRQRFGPALARVSGLPMGNADEGFLLAFSPERVYSGRVLRDLATYPKLVGGVNRTSTDRATRFYQSVLKAEVWELSASEAAEFAKLAETTYRDVNIALANEFARYAEEAGLDVLEAIRGANSQPYSHIHQPGLGVGGHCIPVYPHFLLARSSRMRLVCDARDINDAQVHHYVERIEAVVHGLNGRDVLVLGLTYREGVRELAYTRALPLIAELTARGARVSAYDPLLSDREVEKLGGTPYRWGDESEASVVITQTSDALWTMLNFDLFPRLELLFDGRNSIRNIAVPAHIAYHGVGI